MLKVNVDGSRCQGHTICAMVAPNSFELDEIDGHSTPVSAEVPPEHAEEVRPVCPRRDVEHIIDE